MWPSHLLTFPGLFFWNSLPSAVPLNAPACGVPSMKATTEPSEAAVRLRELGSTYKEDLELLRTAAELLAMDCFAQ
jgi:hypothetical protein